MKKQTKIYNLAFKSQINDNKIYPDNGTLNVITQIPQTTSYQQLNNDRRRTHNIFDQQKYLHKKINLKNQQPYNILCYKQVQAFKSKLKKLKTYGTCNNSIRGKMSQSFLSSSRHTGIFGQLNVNNHLTKEQLINFYQKSKQHNIMQKTRRINTSCSKQLQSDRSHYSTFNNTKIHKLFNANTTNNSPPNQLIDRSKLTQIHKYGPTSSMSLQNHRQKVQKLTKLQIKMQKQNMQPIKWIDNLRNPQPLKTLFDKKYIEQIKRQGIKIKGLNKLQKQYNWIKNQKKCYYFDALENKQKFIKKLCKTTNQQSRIINNVVFNNSNNHGPNNNHISNQPMQ